jgi:hypothetical protein
VQKGGGYKMELETSKAIKELNRRGNRAFIINAVIIGVFVFLFISIAILEKFKDEASDEKLTALIVGALCIVAFIVIIVIILVKKGGSKHVKRYFEEHPDTTVSEIERDFAGADKVFKKLWIGDKCTYYVGQIYPNIIENKELIWVYLTHGSGTNHYWQLNFCERDARMTKIYIRSEKKAKGITKIYNERFKHMVVGYSKELDDLFNNNFEKFLELKYKQNV